MKKITLLKQNFKKSVKKESQKTKKKSHNKAVPCKTFIFNHKDCLCCNKKMKRISGDERYLSNSKKRIKIYLEVYTCDNESCSMYKQRIKPFEFNNIIFPWISYWIDIIAEIWILRFKEHKTVEEIYKIITTDYSHIEITERHILNLINKIMYVFESTWLNHDMIKKRLLVKNKDLKGLSLSIDW